MEAGEKEGRREQEEEGRMKQEEEGGRGERGLVEKTEENEGRKKKRRMKN